MIRTAFGGIVSLAVALAVSACGGSSTAPLTRAQLIAKADPVCRTVVRREDYTSITAAKVVRFAPQLAAVEQRAYEQLSKLTPPASMADDWQLMLDGFRNSARDFRALSHANPREGGRFEQLYGDVRGRAWIGREDGFKDCGRY